MTGQLAYAIAFLGLDGTGGTTPTRRLARSPTAARRRRW